MVEAEVVMKVKIKVVEMVVEVEVVVLVEVKPVRLWQSRHKAILKESSML